MARLMLDTMSSGREPRRPDLTEWNAANSPLLRLPYELRQMIWTYTFSHMAIYPEKMGNAIEYSTATGGCLIFDACMTTLEGNVTQKYQISPVPLICKQIYIESSPIIYSSAYFCFSHSVNLLAFANWFQHVDKVETLWLCIDHGSYDWSCVSRFKSLKGVAIHMRAFPDHYLPGPASRRPGYIADFEPFRQHRLDPAKTHVHMNLQGHPQLGTSRLTGRQIRAFILSYRPRCLPMTTAEAHRLARERGTKARMEHEKRLAEKRMERHVKMQQREQYKAQQREQYKAYMDGLEMRMRVGYYNCYYIARCADANATIVVVRPSIFTDRRRREPVRFACYAESERWKFCCTRHGSESKISYKAIEFNPKCVDRYGHTQWDFRLGNRIFEDWRDNNGPIPSSVEPKHIHIYDTLNDNMILNLP